MGCCQGDEKSSAEQQPFFHEGGAYIGSSRRAAPFLWLSEKEK